MSSTILRTLLSLTLLLLTLTSISAAPAPRPIPSASRVLIRDESQPKPTATPLPFHLQLPSIPNSPDSKDPSNSPNDLYDFYKPWEIKHHAQSPVQLQVKREDSPSPVKRDDIAPVPTSWLAEPTFPADIPSCPKCQENYDSISSCAKASAVFANATSIFNDPLSYIAVIKCSCTDTFQSVFPQCVDCFQNTNQCWFLGTDPQGTGAPEIVSNIRSICGFGSALLGGVATANSVNNTYLTVDSPGTYTDVSTTAAGYIDQSTGDIFGSPAAPTFDLKNSHLSIVAFTLGSVLLGALQTLV